MEDLINRVIRLRQEIEEGSKVDVIGISVELIKIESEIRAINFTDSCEKLKEKGEKDFKYYIENVEGVKADTQEYNNMTWQEVFKYSEKYTKWLKTNL